MDLLAVLPNAESASVPVANEPVGASAPAQAEVDAPNDEAGQISDEACIISATDTGGDASNQGGGTAPVQRDGGVPVRPIAPPVVGPAERATVHPEGLESQQADEAPPAADSQAMSIVSETPALVSFPALEPEQSILQHFEDYVGPTDESNWVIPDLLLVGAYPSVVRSIHTSDSL
jgi:hypothetical protein